VGDGRRRGRAALLAMHLAARDNALEHLSEEGRGVLDC
jgi:hypothetical protein